MIPTKKLFVTNPQFFLLMGADMRTTRGARLLVADGETLRHNGPLALCVGGLHASRRIIDALRYAQGPVLCRVRLGGKIVHDDDKSVAERRTCLWHIDATEVLWAWARRCALDVIGRWDAPDVVRRYLETGDESLRAAAWDAARAAAWTAARAAQEKRLVAMVEAAHRRQARGAPDAALADRETP